jgi:hypothetical protein
LNTPSSLGWLKLYIIGADSPPSSRTVYIRKDGKIYAVLHTDTTGGTKAVNLPADKITGSEYTCILDNGDTTKITVYPYVINVHYIDKTKENL